MKKANILATAALATLLAACSNDSDVFNTPDYADTPIGLNVNVGPMATRAGYDDTNRKAPTATIATTARTGK